MMLVRRPGAASPWTDAVVPAAPLAPGSIPAPPQLLSPPELECGLLYRVVFHDRPWGGFRARFRGWEPSRLGTALEAGRVACWDNGIRLPEGDWRVERILIPPGIGVSDVAA
jgi:hypothetical protein